MLPSIAQEIDNQGHLTMMLPTVNQSDVHTQHYPHDYCIENTAERCYQLLTCSTARPTK